VCSSDLVKGFVNAYVQSGEGVKTAKGDVIVSKDKISGYGTAVTALGLTPSDIAVEKEDTRRANEVLGKIKLDRQEVIAAFKESVANLQDEGMRATAVEALKKFNRMNPNDAIDADEIVSSVESNIEASAKSIKGIRTKDEMRPIVEKLLPPSPYGKK
jgi:lipoate-protein ligase A